MAVLVGLAHADVAPISVNPQRNAYYGDLHLHTSYSFDAYIAWGARVDPDQAYRFAKGEPVEFLGQRLQRREPLDFLAVTDHSENIGVINQLDDPNSAVSRSDLGKAVAAKMASSGPPSARTATDGMWPFVVGIQRAEVNSAPEELKAASAAAWQREIQFANRNYQPGTFTTFIAYEWTAEPGGTTLHRNVIFRGNSAPYPFTSFDSKKPEALWAWLQKIRGEGYEALAIPHNGNLSNGLMYDWVTSDGHPIDAAYAQARAANEPLSEISQVKGQSETHPLLSPTDEFAGFSLIRTLVDPKELRSHPAPGSFLRDALGRGLMLERQGGINPFQYGFVGGSDLHSGLTVSAQADLANNLALADLQHTSLSREQAEGILERSVGPQGAYTLRLTAGSLTGVWAESNTRESIYSALRRRETFATSGTKLKFRFFGGWDFNAHHFDRQDWISGAYVHGVPMGGALPRYSSKKAAPEFIIWAAKDPNGANLDRVQVVKVWEDGGHPHEKVFDVAWAGRRTPDRATGKLPAVGNTVDLNTGQYSNSIGAVELKTVWIDPEFDSRKFAAYYLRVLEIPTPRWSTLLAIAGGLPLPEAVPATEQQRGWSSPIWYDADEAIRKR